jgi:glycosyltransferase involved in cell wall biosynthesis
MQPTVVHVAVTNKFAGVERYVANTATELAQRGCVVHVVGGAPAGMRAALGDNVRWLPGSTVRETLRSLAKVGRCDVCHVHMTLAEGSAVLARPVHRAPIVSTRHFAERRGSSPVSRALSPLIARSLAREIAASRFIADRMERPPDSVLTNGVPPAPNVWDSANRTIVVLQRFEREKDTATALEAWALSRLWEEGWSLRLVGDGSQRSELEAWVKGRSVPEVSFAGWVPDVQDELTRAGMVLAPAPAEPFGLGVIEAMGAGVPVVACGGGGHLETVARLSDAPLFARMMRGLPRPRCGRFSRIVSAANCRPSVESLSSPSFR